MTKISDSYYMANVREVTLTKGPNEYHCGQRWIKRDHVKRYQNNTCISNCGVEQGGTGGKLWWWLDLIGFANVRDMRKKTKESRINPKFWPEQI